MADNRASGIPRQILSAWRQDLFTMTVSISILDGYWRSGERLAARFPTVDPTPLLNLVSTHAVVIATTTFDSPICDDPNDDKFLECAIAAKADAIVTGDKALLRLAPFRGIPILRPRAFADMFLAR